MLVIIKVRTTDAYTNCYYALKVTITRHTSQENNSIILLLYILPSHCLLGNQRIKLKAKRKQSQQLEVFIRVAVGSELGSLFCFLLLVVLLCLIRFLAVPKTSRRNKCIYSIYNNNSNSNRITFYTTSTSY